MVSDASERYIHYEQEGDQHVGRVAAGLPVNSHLFAILPPFFPDRMALQRDIDAAIADCFPDAPPAMREPLEYMMASLLFHEAYLMATLPRSSPLWFDSTLSRGRRGGALSSPSEGCGVLPPSSS